MHVVQYLVRYRADEFEFYTASLSLFLVIKSFFPKYFALRPSQYTFFHNFSLTTYSGHCLCSLFLLHDMVGWLANPLGRRAVGRAPAPLPG